jgi:hypothetical protein
MRLESTCEKYTYQAEEEYGAVDQLRRPAYVNAHTLEFGEDDTDCI